MRRLILLLQIFLLSSYLFALQNQAIAAQQDEIEQKFRAFDYDAVIQLATEALEHAADYPQETLFQIYEMKAVAHYSKMEMTEALHCFVDILNIDPAHELDPMKYSPKIVGFYNELKKNINKPSEQTTQQDEAKPDTVFIHQMDNSFKKYFYPSLIAPGSGQWLSGKKQKGIFLTAASTGLLASSIYFTLDCSQKEKDYLNATIQDDIDEKYSIYNSSYKTRNALWAAYTLVWVYSQVDLFFSNNNSPVQVGLVVPSLSSHTFGFVLRAKL